MLDCSIDGPLHGFWRITLHCFLIYVGLPGVLWVLPDSYIDVKNKDYGGWFVQLFGEIKERFYFIAVANGHTISPFHLVGF